MSAAVLRVWVGAQLQQQRHHLQATGTGCEVQESSSRKTARRDRGITVYSIDHEANQTCAAGLHHPRQQSNEHRGMRGNSWGESEDFIVIAANDCGYGIIYNTLLAPTCG